MIANNVEVVSKELASDTAHKWESNGTDGYTISSAPKENVGTTITLHIKDDTDDIKYSDYLEEYKIRNIVKRYSDYIHYPIIMKCENRKLKEGSSDEYETIYEDETLNSMTPIWKKNKKDTKHCKYQA